MSVVCSAMVFAYGTLRDPAVQQALFGRTVPGDDAVLEGWGLYRSESDGFLFIKLSESVRVSGLILRLSGDELQIADAWEDVPLYHRERVVVVSGSIARDVWTYTRRDGVGVEHNGESNSGHPHRDVIEWASQLRAERRSSSATADGD